MWNMLKSTLISLQEDWTVEYLELDPSLYEFMERAPVPRLQDWSFDRRRVEGWVAWLERKFILPASQGNHVLLYIDSAPEGMGIYLNHRRIATYAAPADDAPPFELDISREVQPGQNVIALRVEGTAPAIEGLALEVIAADGG